MFFPLTFIRAHVLLGGFDVVVLQEKKTHLHLGSVIEEKKERERKKKDKSEKDEDRRRANVRQNFLLLAKMIKCGY